MHPKTIKKVSKFLSLILRHKPEAIGIQLDRQGWANTEELIRKMSAKGTRVDRTLLEEVVAQNNKKRFSFNADGTKIRANQGHSIQIDLGLEAVEPPEFLYHGTATRFLDSIRQSGLEKRSRQHVHLSKDKATAINVGGRHGKPVILIVEAGKMHKAGYSFFISKNGVWLTDNVPVTYLQFPE